VICRLAQKLRMFQKIKLTKTLDLGAKEGGGIELKELTAFVWVMTVSGHEKERSLGEIISQTNEEESRSKVVSAFSKCHFTTLNIKRREKTGRQDPSISVVLRNTDAWPEYVWLDRPIFMGEISTRTIRSTSCTHYLRFSSNSRVERMRIVD